MGGKLTTTGNIGQYIVLFLRVCTFLESFHVRLGKKGKMLVFTGVYVCVKSKLTLVSFVFLFCLHLFLIPLLFVAKCDAIFKFVWEKKKEKLAFHLFRLTRIFFRFLLGTFPFKKTMP